MDMGLPSLSCAGALVRVRIYGPWVDVKRVMFGLAAEGASPSSRCVDGEQVPLHHFFPFRPARAAARFIAFRSIGNSHGYARSVEVRPKITSA